jgi:CheY-like chemotaxis protein
MIKTLKCIMLIDDNPDDNFFHERVIRKNNAAELVVSRRSGAAALEYLQGDDNHVHPDLIFLDINMPGMNGWEFLEEYHKLDKRFQSHALVIMLTTSENPDDRMRAEGIVPEFKTKPLTKEILEEVISQHFG